MSKQEPEGFSIFWEQVWRPHARHTDGRGLARDTYAKHIKAGALPQDIIDGAKCFFRTMKDRDRDYVPLASTWLNREAYIDLAEQERAYQARITERSRVTAENLAASANVVSIDQGKRDDLGQRLRDLATSLRAPA